MKVLLINGSPRKSQCTYTALSEVADSLQKEGVDAEVEWIGTGPIRGCQACRSCAKRGEGRCIFDDDVVNVLLAKAEAADGLVVGSPVYYAGANGALLATLDRMFFSGSHLMRFKPGAGISSARRAGTTPAIDQINKYFQINMMPLVSSNYWPMVHGNNAEEARQDLEGMQTMRMLGRNMAWLLKSLEAAKAQGVELPKVEPKVATNFIR